MEQGPHHPEGGEHRHETHEIQPELHGDEQRIERAIAEALNDERAIDDGTAQRIAALLHTGQDSALYALASSGALPDRLEAELLESVQDLPPERDSWIDALLAYAEGRGENRGPKEGWADAIGDDAQAAIEAARAAASRERRADRARLEHYVELGLDPGDAEAVIEFQHMWRQQRAAETTPGTAQPDEAAQLSEAAEGSTGPERQERPQPRIYVRCLAAYNNGILHGQWIDANQDVEALRDAVETMLTASPVPDAEEYAIHDHEGFTGYPLGEYEHLAFVSRLAQGITEHGQAFAAYAEWSRQDDPDLERFSEAYEGTYPTREAWAEEVVDEIFEWPRYREALPEILRPHVQLDLTDLALTLEQHRHVVEGSDGVYVFNPDA